MDRFNLFINLFLILEIFISCPEIVSFQSGILSLKTRDIIYFTERKN